MNTNVQQESPPAWTEEAYRPPCSEYSFCCPNWVPPRPNRVGGYLPGTPQQGTPWVGYPLAGYPPGPGTPPVWYPPPAGPGRVPPQLPHGILGNVAKHYGIWVPPWTDRQTRVKTLPSCRTTYAGGKNVIRISTKSIISQVGYRSGMVNSK